MSDRLSGEALWQKIGEIAMATVFNLLNRIQRNPGLYLGYPSVSALFMLLNGYELARSELGVELTPEEEHFFEEFQPWLQQKLGVKSVTSWAKLIMLSCHDEKTGFTMFFTLLDEFQHECQSTELVSA